MFCALIIIRVKGKPLNGRKYLHIVHPMTDSYTEHTEDS